MGKKCWLVLIIAIGGGVVGWNSEQEKLIDSYIKNVYMIRNQIPGVGLTIVENNEIVVAKGYGYKNVDKKLNADGDTLMCIGSITKSFLGTLVVKVLHEKFPKLGEKALDTPLNNLLPESSRITFIDRYRTESMTFRDLLSHRSCLVNPGWDVLFDTVTSNAEKRYRIRYLKEACAFRSGFVYNNALYGLAGHLIGDIAGVPIDRLLVQFMREIGMNDSYIIDRDGNFANLEHMSQFYFIRDNKTQIYNPRLLTRIHTEIAAGAILSSPKDMSQYILFHLNLGKVGKKQVIPREVMKRVYKVSSGPLNLLGKNSSKTDPVTTFYAYSLGFGNMLINGWAAIEHGGTWGTFISELFIIPALNIGIYISCNGPGEFQLESDFDLGLKIFDVLMGKISDENEMKVNLNLTMPVQNETPKILKTDLGPRSNGTKEIAELVGVYGHPTDGDMTISYNSSHKLLQMKIGKFGTGNLIEISPLKYKIIWTGDILHHWYASGINAKLLDDFLDFGYENKVVMDGVDDTEVLCEFTKGESIHTFPSIPWEVDSASVCFSTWEFSFHLISMFLAINYSFDSFFFART